VRDPIAEIVSYNKPLLDHPVPRASGPGDLTVEALRRKLDALAASPFGFFRGTFHLMAWDLLQERVPLAKSATPEGLIVGDLHLENFGVYRGANGTLVFDVNDFDDVGQGPLDLDLKRLCTSALLMPGLAMGVRLGAARTLARGWSEEVAKLGGRFPVPPWTADKAAGTVKELLEESGHKTRAAMIAKVAPDKDHRKLSGEKFAAPAKPWLRIVEQAFAEYLESLKQLKAPEPPKGCEVLDVAYRFKGLGSLGRLRFTVLIGRGEERRLLELKEARASAMGDPQAAGRSLAAGGREPPRPDARARPRERARGGEGRRRALHQG
jgi:hypothetical protein